MKIFYQTTVNDCSVAIIKTFFYYFYHNQRVTWNNQLLKYDLKGISIYNFEQLLDINDLKVSFFEITQTHNFTSKQPFGFIYLYKCYRHFYTVISVNNNQWLISNMNHKRVLLPVSWINKRLKNIIFFQINKC